MNVDPFSTVVGQPAAVDRLRAAAVSPVHAYLFLGPHGSGKRTGALAFAAALLARDRDDADRQIGLALHGRHPDVFVLEPAGRTLRVEEAATLAIEASRSPIEGRRKVVIADRFHAAEPEAAASLLKAVEEPPGTAVFVLLAEDVPPEHVTIASRCTTIEFVAVSDDAIRDHLVGHGADADRAAVIAAAARGDVRRAELLVDDAGLAARRELWWTAPERLDGTGTAVAFLVDELRAAVDAAQEPLVERHRVELEELAAREEQLGTRGSGRRDVEARHRRETRRLRDDELRFGFATLAERARRDLIDRHPPALAVALAELRWATDALQRNPNENLLLQRLLLRFPPAPAGTAAGTVSRTPE